MKTTLGFSSEIADWIASKTVSPKMAFVIIFMEFLILRGAISGSVLSEGRKVGCNQSEIQIVAKAKLGAESLCPNIKEEVEVISL